MGGGKVGTHFIKRLQQGWDVKTLLYYGAFLFPDVFSCCQCPSIYRQQELKALQQAGLRSP